MCCSVLRRSVMFDYSHPMDCSPPGSSVHGDSPGQNTGVGSLSLLQGNLPNPGIKSRSPALQEDSLPAEPQGKPKNTGLHSLSVLQGSSQPRNQTGVSCPAGRFFNSLATRESLLKEYIMLIMSFLWFQHNLLSVLALMQITI